MHAGTVWLVAPFAVATAAGALVVTSGTAAALASPQPEPASSECVLPQAPPGLFALRDLACGVGVQSNPSSASANPGQSTSY